jgi:hypothetical protein
VSRLRRSRPIGDREATAALIETAKGYPFARPDHSYLFVDGDALPLLSFDGALEDAEVAVDGHTVVVSEELRRRGIASIAPMERREPVLAYGANAAPERLRLKFAPCAPAVFPVLRTRLHGFDVVYAAHVSSYGAIPATLERSPGTICEIATTYLDTAQVARMHETEFSRHTYRFGQIVDIHVELEYRATLDAVGSYVGGYGHIAPEGEPFALAAISATNRRFRALSQTEMHRTAHALLGAEISLDAFIQQAIADEAIRRERTASLRARARPFSHPRFDVLAE